MKVDAKRAKTMRERLGEAAELVDSDQYLPMYRNRQIHYPQLFEFSVKLAKRGDKRNASRYFATLWKSENLKKTIDWLTKLMNLAQSKAAELVRDLQRRRQEAKEARERKKNAANLDRLQQIKAGMFNPGINPMKA